MILFSIGRMTALTPSLDSTTGPRVIGLAGRMGCGKDTVAARLSERGYIRVALADAVRREVAAAIGLGIAPSAMSMDMMQDLFAADAEEVWGKPTTERMRRILQWWGTELRRSQNPDYWVWRLQEQMPADERFVVSDIRFPNEVDFVRSLGGEIWWIDRDSEVYGLPDHVSETLPRETADKVIDNHGDVERLAAEIGRCLGSATHG